MHKVHVLETAYLGRVEIEPMCDAVRILGGKLPPEWQDGKGLQRIAVFTGFAGNAEEYPGCC